MQKAESQSILGCTCDEGKALDAIKVGMFDGHDARIGKDLLGEVVDELAVDKAVDAVVYDGVHLGAHLVPLRLLYVRHLAITRAATSACGRPHQHISSSTYLGHRHGNHGL